LMDALVTDLIEATRSRLRKLRIRSVEQVRAKGSRLVALSPRMPRESKLLKKFLFENLYSHKHIRAKRRQIVLSVEGLFRFFVERPRSLPPSYFDKTQKEPTHRVVCDYIAGMTDNYLQEQYRKYVG